MKLSNAQIEEIQRLAAEVAELGDPEGFHAEIVLMCRELIEARKMRDSLDGVITLNTQLPELHDDFESARRGYDRAREGKS